MRHSARSNNAAPPPTHLSGAQIPVAAYTPLGVAIQQAAPFPVWISIPASTLDVPEPSAGPAVTRGLKAL